MKNVYDKEALNRIAAQDKLDSMIVLVSPAVWVSIIGAFVVIFGLILWGFFGKLPTQVDIDGIYVNSEGTGKVYSEKDGFVTEVLVNVGDEVEEDQVIAVLGTEDDYFNIQQMDKRIQYVENMTFDSEMDVVTQDTEQMAQIKLNAKNSAIDSEETKANLELKKEKLADAKADVEEKEALMLQYKEKFFETLSITDNQTQMAYQEASDDYDTYLSHYESAKNTYLAAAESYNTRLNSFNEKYQGYDSDYHSEEENTAYESALAELDAARAQMEDDKYFMQQEEEKVRTANNALDTARKAYLEYLNKVSGENAENTMASTEYSEVLQDYATAKANYQSLLDAIDELELKSVLDEGSAELNEDNARSQFDNQKSAILHDLQDQRDSLLNQAMKSEIRSSQAGYVYDVPISVGSAVARGAEVLGVLRGDLDKDSVICYVKLEDAKKLEEGMEAYIFPSTVNRQEYGHIDGSVVAVDSVVATHKSISDALGNDILVSDFEKDGPCIEVRLSMKEDSNDDDGYNWKTNKGKVIKISQGTVVSASIITEEKKPIDLLIPYLKSKLDFEDEEQ